MSQSATIFIKRSVSEVYEYVMEVSHDAEWRSGVVEAAYTSEGPPGIGTTGFDRVVANGREVLVTWTVVEYKPGTYARWTLDSGPIRGRGGYVCEQTEGGTSFTLEANVKPAGMYRLLGPIFSIIGRRQNQADTRKLKAILEGTT